MRWYVLGILACLCCIGVSIWGAWTHAPRPPASAAGVPTAASVDHQEAAVTVVDVAARDSQRPEPVTSSENATTSPPPAGGGGVVQASFTVVDP